MLLCSLFLSPSEPVAVAVVVKNFLNEIKIHDIYSNRFTNHCFYSSISSFVYPGNSQKATLKQLKNKHCIFLRCNNEWYNSRK